MKKFKIGALLAFICLTISVNAQEAKKFKIHTVAFYNLENLFDTINDPNKNDEASPIMEMKVNTSTIYKKKVHNMARVLADIGTDTAKNSPVIIGVAEVENIKVLEDVVNDPQLFSKDYGVIHYDSPDRRGIDVGLIYQKKYFTPTHSSNHELVIIDDRSGRRVYTRDQLLVSGKLDGELIHILVNHWPSRSGGEARSRPKRVAAAKLSKKIIDSLQTADPYAKVIIMGDFNDDPTNTSIKDVLGAKKEKEDVALKGIYNPFESLFKMGIGSNAYRDSWSLFDQVLVTQPFLEKDYSSWRLYQAHVFNKNYLVNKKGRYKGYPFRSFSNGGFTDGFSDHFPAYIYLIKQVD
ncbi:endonuclease/exonuclease/phosphatase family protein [Bizionia sediminis]|uniref:Endonuclease/exonuclease/phosphatase family protein n=1 Tax=Bizionia sediminis TaxID=1737064 RepID=A0ABW5KUQ7_9FLAO